jgi:hypothetical protein
MPVSSLTITPISTFPLKATLRFTSLKLSGVKAVAVVMPLGG